MCGICGVIRSRARAGADEAMVASLNASQRHRGPDASGCWTGGRAALGQTRLAIVDLTDGGRQPFLSPDGAVSVVFNGEIYNHEDLRRKHGLTTPDRCDGAILPELWTRLGTAMFRELRGMYAIAVYDDRDLTITLARDPFGIKPLYWTTTPDGALAFASECRPLLDLRPDSALRAGALQQYLMFGALGRDQSPFTSIEAVPANRWVRWDDALTAQTGAVHPGLLAGLPPSSPQELRAEFLRSVSLHLISDVPLALLLSAGLDSASIAWACRELGTSAVCVTVDQGVGMGEAAGAARVAARFGHQHECVRREPDEAEVQHYFRAMQRPTIDGLNTFVVSRAIAGLNLKVAVSGLGGDEMLAGYRSFRMLRGLSLLRLADRLRLSRPLVKACGSRHEKLAQLLGPGGPRDAVGLGTLTRRLLLDQQVQLLAPWAATPSAATPGGNDRSARSLSQYEIENFLGGMLLPDTDAFSMASSIELRVPFVDAPLARRALAVDTAKGVGKRGFAACLGDPELRRIAGQKKRGFTLPMDRWMRAGPLTAFVQMAQSPTAPVREILQPEAVDAVLVAWRDGRLSWSRAWSLVALNGWLLTLQPSTVRTDSMLAGQPLTVA